MRAVSGTKDRSVAVREMRVSQAAKGPKNDPVRVRTVTWQDPVTSVEAARKLSGLDHLRRIRDGITPPPPIAELLGFVLTKVEPGDVTFEFDPAEYH